MTPGASWFKYEMLNEHNLGESRFASPLKRKVSDDARMHACIVDDRTQSPRTDHLFEVAGPRENIFFNPDVTRAGIVTCGGLCPGLNNVIRSIYLELTHHYGVKQVLGFRDGFGGILPQPAKPPIALDDDYVEDIHREGGTVLGTSRGPVDIAAAVTNLIDRDINILFVIGGDGTQRGGYELYLEAKRRGHSLSVVGVPKTIDNDIPFVARTFGYLTAVEEADRVLKCAHTEVHSVHNGIALVKLMGRHAGFIAASATIANQDVNFTLVPEVPFALEGENGFLACLKRRVIKRAHAVIVVAEGAGQDILAADPHDKDASGNTKLKDIGPYLRDRIEEYFKVEKIPFVFRYFDPSYLVRSVPADSEDAILCDHFARNAVHAAMAGKTGIVIGLFHDHYIHVPVELIVKEKRRLNPDGGTWHAVLAATGQPASFE